MKNSPKNPSIDLRTSSTEPPPVKLAEFPRYLEAQKAVDRLSDDGFPVEHLSIVWAGLRHIEYVTGRRTVASAAKDGALSGAWFGFVIGVLFALFADTSDPVVGLWLTYAIVGAVAGSLYSALGHWMRRGTRDFATQGTLDAERFEVWVSPEVHVRAQAILGIVSTRPMDPAPAPDQST